MVPMVVMMLLLTSVTGIVSTAVAVAVAVGRMCRHRRSYMVLEGSGRCRRRCGCCRLTNLGHGALVACRTHLVLLLHVPHARSMPKKVFLIRSFLAQLVYHFISAVVEFVEVIPLMNIHAASGVAAYAVQSGVQIRAKLIQFLLFRNER
uniref:Putative secreted peptide n=1 Tax=Anopheles braziliensis TaxID=58242 RepID=A0A2M3ZPR5_9DIPT